MLIIVISVFLAAGCSRKPKIVERPGQPDLTYFDPSDQEIKDAVAKARATLSSFIAEIERKPPTTSKSWPKLAHLNDTELDFTIKVPYPNVRGGHEHIWIRVARHSGKQFRGWVANSPVDVPDLRVDQAVEIEDTSVEDWMITEPDGHFRGGYTVRVLLSRGAQLPEGQYKP